MLPVNFLGKKKKYFALLKKNKDLAKLMRHQYLRFEISIQCNVFSVQYSVVFAKSGQYSVAYNNKS